jgi:hypothetical protein
VLGEIAVRGHLKVTLAFLAISQNSGELINSLDFGDISRVLGRLPEPPGDHAVMRRRYSNLSLFPRAHRSTADYPQVISQSLAKELYGDSFASGRLSMIRPHVFKFAKYSNNGDTGHHGVVLLGYVMVYVTFKPKGSRYDPPLAVVFTSSIFQ